MQAVRCHCAAPGHAHRQQAKSNQWLSPRLKVMPSFQVSKLGCDSHRMHTRGGRWVACQQAAGRCSSHPTCPHPSPTCPSLPALTGPSTFLLTHRTILQPIPHPCFLLPIIPCILPSIFFLYIYPFIHHPSMCPFFLLSIHHLSIRLCSHPHIFCPILCASTRLTTSIETLAAMPKLWDCCALSQGKHS